MSFAAVNAQRSTTTNAVACSSGNGVVIGTIISKNVAPAVPSGFARRRNVIIGGLLSLALLYHGVYNLVKDMDSYWFRPANEYCAEGNIIIADDGTKTCHRPDLFAFQVASGVMQLYMGCMGFWTWHISRRVNAFQTPEGRLFGYLKEADHLNTAIFIYQTFDFFASMMVPEHATAVFLTHHAMAAFTAWMSLNFQMVHYYAIFFGGCSEVSTIFLVLCDFDVYFPAARGSLWAIIILFCQVSFTFTFLYYRVIGWFTVSLSLWSDVLTLSKKKAIEQYRPGLSWFVYAFLVMDFLLGLLQLYWFGFGIVPKILDILQSDES